RRAWSDPRAMARARPTQHEERHAAGRPGRGAGYRTDHLVPDDRPARGSGPSRAAPGRNRPARLEYLSDRKVKTAAGRGSVAGASTLPGRPDGHLGRRSAPRAGRSCPGPGQYQCQYQQKRRSARTEGIMKEGTITAASELEAVETKDKNVLRRRLLMLSVPLLVLLVGAYFWLTSGRYVSTDNAYVQQDKVSIAAEVGGRIVEANVRENQQVKKGDLLFRIDPRPYRI